MNDIPDTQTVEVPIDVASHSEPLGSQVPQSEVKAAPEAPKPPSAREAIEAAHKAVSDKEAKTRADDGKFAAKEAPKPEVNPKVAEAPVAKATGVTEKPVSEVLPEKQSKYEPPSRFNEAAKREWATAPESVQAEIARMAKENEDGLGKYKASHERYEQLKQYDEISKQNGRDLTASLKQVTEIEAAFARNPIEGFKKVAEWGNFNIQAVAAHILGQDPTQASQEANQQLAALQAENRALKAQIEAPNQVQEFANKVGVDAFEANSEKLATLLKSGIVHDLDAAWSLIQVFGGNRASDAQSGQPLIPAQSAAAHTDAPAQTQPNPAGQKSVTGAPNAGSTIPAKKGPAPSIRDAINQAAGLR